MGRAVFDAAMRPVVIVLLDPTGDGRTCFNQAAILGRPAFLFENSEMPQSREQTSEKKPGPAELTQITCRATGKAAPMLASNSSRCAASSKNMTAGSYRRTWSAPADGLDGRTAGPGEALVRQIGAKPVPSLALSFHGLEHMSPNHDGAAELTAMIWLQTGTAAS